MNNIFLILLSFFDSGIRFVATFVYQTNADQQSVSALYKFLVVSNLFCIPFFLLIPVTYRFGHFGRLNNIVSSIYFHLLLFLMIIYLMIVSFLISYTEVILIYSVAYGFCLASFGTLISILNVQQKIKFLQILKLFLGFCIASVLTLALIFKINYLSVFTYFIISTIGCCVISALKINFNAFFLIKLRLLYRWIKLATHRYRGVAINNLVLLVYGNIDRLIVTNIADDSFINQYAISTTISAPIIVVANVLQLRYWPTFAKKNSVALYNKQLMSMLFVSFVLIVSCIGVYFLILGFKLFPDRLPSFGLYFLVVSYYAAYPVTQFNLFYSGLMHPSLVRSCTILFCSLIAYFFTTSVSQLVVALPLLMLVFVITPIMSFKKLKKLL